MADRDPDQVRAFVEHLALVFTDWGFPRMPSRVLITLSHASSISSLNDIHNLVKRA